ncbi:MAG: hypothetical protein LBJ12_00895 [Oscillospiraceae bacterium]|nr:hypothetical protein [Oscillospiraceae bacterium]
MTAHDITKACGLNRQRFYDHFNDKYALLNWIFDSEVFQFTTQYLALENWQEIILGNLTIVYCNGAFNVIIHTHILFIDCF